MKRLVLFIALIAFPSAAAAQTQCVKGKPCGDDKAWVASSHGEVYYRRGCGSASRLAPEHRVYFGTEEEAKRAGYRRSGSPGC